MACEIMVTMGFQNITRPHVSPLWQVFAGLLDPTGNSSSVKILKAIESERQKESEPVGAGDNNPQQLETARARGQIVPLELDPTREDSLRACLDAVRAKLPAGEDGKLFFINLVRLSQLMKLNKVSREITTSF